MARSAAHDAAGGEGGDALTAAAVADAVGGRLLGDGTHALRGLAPLDRAEASHLSFLGSARYLEAFQGSRAGVVLVPPELAEVEGGPAIRIVVAKPHEALLSLIPRFHPPRRLAPGVHPAATLGRGVQLGADVHVGAGAVLGDGVVLGDRATIGATSVVGDGARVGEDSVVHAGATLYPGTILGKRVIVHSGVRLGSDGYGYVFRDGAHQKIPHVGRCILEDDVEVGANATIDRGSIDDTVIGAGTKIDNLVQIGHNVRIGRLCLIMSQVGISGSARIEDGCIIAGQAGIAGHHVIGKGARVGGQAGVFGDVPAGETWSGYPARPHGESMRAQAAMLRLPKLIRALERLVNGAERPG